MPIENYQRLLEEAFPSEIREGKEWYRAANRWVYRMSATTGYSPKQVAGVVAVLSPMVEWNLNRRYAHTFLVSKGRAKGPGFKGNRQKALAVLRGDLSVVKGPKVRAFFASLLNPVWAEPVIDTQMLAAWQGKKAYKEEVTYGEIGEVKEGIKRIAGERGWTVAETQATLWTVFKRVQGKYGKQLRLWE